VMQRYRQNLTCQELAQKFSPSPAFAADYQ